MTIAPAVLHELPKHHLFHFKYRKFVLKIRQTKTNQNKALPDKGSEESCLIERVSRPFIFEIFFERKSTFDNKVYKQAKLVKMPLNLNFFLLEG